MEKNHQTRGGRQARVGFRFSEEMKSIKIERLKKGNSEDMVSTEQLSNLITRHESWKLIKQDLIKANQEEIDKHGK